MSGTIITSGQLVEIILQRRTSARSMTAIAGPPGSGKSTLAEMLVKRLNEKVPDSAAIFPMDGYHYDDWVLEPAGLLPRKGAPQTFDATGFAQMLMRLRANEEDEIAVPVFDRSLEIARAGARLISASTKFLIVEGNYLLLKDPPWSELKALFDTTVFIDTPRETLVERLADRWRDLDSSTAEAKLYGNDLPNADLVNTNSAKSEFILKSP